MLYVVLFTQLHRTTSTCCTFLTHATDSATEIKQAGLHFFDSRREYQKVTQVIRSTLLQHPKLVSNVASVFLHQNILPKMAMVAYEKMVSIMDIFEKKLKSSFEVLDASYAAELPQKLLALVRKENELNETVQAQMLQMTSTSEAKQVYYDWKVFGAWRLNFKALKRNMKDMSADDEEVGELGNTISAFLQRNTAKVNDFRTFVGCLTATQGLFRPLRQAEARPILAAKLRDGLVKQKMLRRLPPNIAAMLESLAPEDKAVAGGPDSSDEL